jgi:phage repressor protein C with HTH and peptisase S24 domain
MSLIERIYQLSDFKGDSIYKISKEIDVSNGYFAKTKAKNGSVGSEIIEKIVSYYPDLNVEWLITGNGEMIKTKSLKNVLKKNEDIYEDINEDKPNVKKTYAIELAEKPTNTGIEANNLGNAGIPLIPIDAMAGFGTGAVQVMHYDTSKYIVPEFSELNVDFMIRVKGSSMVPKYNSGDLVACKKLVITDIFFQWNKVYVLDTEQGALIKRVKKGSRDNYILLISDNKNYDPFELHLSKIFAVALVVGVIRLE